MISHIKFDDFGPVGITWMGLYRACSTLNGLQPYSLAVFKRNVKRLIKSGTVDQSTLNEAKTRPANGCESRFIIYRISHVKSDLSYIGITDDWETRKVCHARAKEQNILHAAIRRDGWRNFKTETIVNGIMTRTAARRIEKSFILSERTLTPNGYNQRT